jgi:hypothetical protein
MSGFVFDAKGNIFDLALTKEFKIVDHLGREMRPDKVTIPISSGCKEAKIRAIGAPVISPIIKFP